MVSLSAEMAGVHALGFYQVDFSHKKWITWLKSGLLFVPRGVPVMPVEFLNTDF